MILYTLITAVILAALGIGCGARALQLEKRLRDCEHPTDKEMYAACLPFVLCMVFFLLALIASTISFTLWSFS